MGRIVAAAKSGKKQAAAPVVVDKKSVKSAKPASGKLDVSSVELPAEPIIDVSKIVDPHHGKAFSKEEVARLEVAELRVVNAQQQAQIISKNIQDFAREAQAKIEAAKADLRAKESETNQRAVELQRLHVELESKHGIKMAEITYDPKSGKIMSMPAPVLEQRK